MREDREEKDYQPDMPPIESGGYLLGYLWEIGPTLPSAAGPVPVTNMEIAAWAHLVGLMPAPWESRLLRRLSREYVQELRQAEKPDRPAPWQPVEHVPDYSGVAKSMRKSIGAMAKF